jgi:prolyl-tRNA synthetase
VHDALIVVDESVRDSPNLVAGANRPGYHLRNVNLGRDYQAGIVTDIASAAPGHPCPACGSPLTAERAIEIGNIFKLGTRYSAALGATYLDADGQSHPIVMGSYGIGSGRLAATIVEQYHDDKGITWPVSVAPFQVALLSLGVEAEVTEAADQLATDLSAAGIEILYDDRPDRAGVKFNDADLIGCPIRLSVSTRTLARGEAELKPRTAAEARFVPLGDVVTTVGALLAELSAELVG